MKFGGTSLGDISRIKIVANKIKEEVSNRKKVIVVVSAMASTTNNLINLIEQITDDYDLIEHDAILSTGEQISSSLLS